MKTVDQACLELGRRLVGYNPRELSVPVQRMLAHLIELSTQKAITYDGLKALENLKPEPPSLRGAAGRAKNLSNRLERLEEESPHWLAAIENYHGNLQKIADYIGCSRETAIRALRDLGLTEVAKQARMAKSENQ